MTQVLQDEIQYMIQKYPKAHKRQLDESVVVPHMKPDANIDLNLDLCPNKDFILSRFNMYV